MNKIIILVFLAFTSSISAQTDRYCVQDSIIDIVNNQIGVGYKWGTSKPNISFDCSGFTSYVYNACNISAPRSSKLYGQKGENVSTEEAQTGDCILFSGTKNTSIGHVGIVIRNDESGLYFAHCSSSKKHFGVTITRLQESGYLNRFISIRRIF